MLKTFSARIAARTCLIALCFFIISLLTAGYALATSNIVFILDASGSMNGNIGNETKMTAAKRVLSDLLNELPADAQVGLMAYGHTVSKEKAGACEDIAILSPIGQETPQALAQKVNALQPMGMTPIASSLIKSVEAFKGVQGGNNHVVLISDGLETCGSDPCKAAKALTEANINARVHVIGFDVGAKEAAELACIPKMGNGKYFRANNIEELKLAIAEIKKVTEVAEVIEEPKVEEPPKKKAEPKPTEYEEVWRDDFDGEELADHWEVINPDPESFIVENGVLTVIAASHEPLQGSDKLSNIFRLTKPLPKGDWTVTMRLKPEVSTFRENYIMGIYSDKDKMLTATAGTRLYCCDGAITLSFWGDKRGKEKNTGFSVAALKSPGIGGLPGAIKKLTDWTKKNLQAILLRIEKSGRAYTISTKIEGELTMAGGKKPVWVKVQKLTSLRPPGDSVVIAFNQIKFTHGSYQVPGGESLMAVDWIKIEAPSE